MTSRNTPAYPCAGVFFFVQADHIGVPRANNAWTTNAYNRTDTTPPAKENAPDMMSGTLQKPGPQGGPDELQASIVLPARSGMTSESRMAEMPERVIGVANTFWMISGICCIDWGTRVTPSPRPKETAMI